VKQFLIGLGFGVLAGYGVAVLQDSRWLLQDRLSLRRALDEERRGREAVIDLRGAVYGGRDTDGLARSVEERLLRRRMVEGGYIPR